MQLEITIPAKYLIHSEATHREAVGGGGASSSANARPDWLSRASLCHLLASFVTLSNFLAFLCFTFLICKMGIILLTP